MTRSAVKYSGDFEKNFRDGVGVLADRKPNKTFRLIYRGDWKRGYRSGYGAMHYPDGGYCEGYWKNGKRHGYAQMWYGDGSYYDGDFYKDLRHGSGLFVYPNGNRYSCFNNSTSKYFLNLLIIHLRYIIQIVGTFLVIFL